VAQPRGSRTAGTLTREGLHGSINQSGKSENGENGEESEKGKKSEKSERGERSRHTVTQPR
jgi:hypothetical protein